MRRMWDEAVRGWGEGRERCRAKQMPGTLMRARRVPLLKNAAVSKRREKKSERRGWKKRKMNREVSLQRNVAQQFANLGKQEFVFFSLINTVVDMQTFFFQVNMKTNYTHTHTESIIYTNQTHTEIAFMFLNHYSQSS